MNRASNELPVEVMRLPHGEGVELPAYQSARAAGMDVRAALTDPVVIEPGAVELIPSGFAMALPAGYEAQLRPRSGLAAKHAISMPNAPGTIDADYRGEVKVLLMNFGGEPFTVERGMRIAQMVIAPVTRAHLCPVEQLAPTERGEGGFGHTGH